MSDKTCTACGQSLAEGRKLSLCPACLTKGWQRAKSDAPPASTTFEIPGYEITGEIARGGMGIVYRARQRSPQREVAVKMLLPQIALDDLRERFRIEAKVMADLVHPGIMPIYQYGEHAGIPWISMALCDRGSLAARMEEYRGQWRRIGELMKTLAEAVAFAHAHGVLHRDLKPGNVLFDDGGRVFLSDFGLAKIVGEPSDLTRTLSLIGTPHYLAPELVSNSSQVTTASDLYALGAILYELLVSRPPFDGHNVAAILQQISDGEPAPLPVGVPRDLATIALKCLHKQPAQRYASAQAFAEDLQRWLNGGPITARRMSAGQRLVFWCRRKPSLAAISALLFVGAVIALVLILTKNRELNIALQQSREVLRASLLTQIRHTRISARVQDRDAALKAVRQAAAIYTTPELEEEAASLLAMTSLAQTQVITGISGHSVYVPDENLERVVNFMNGNDVCIEEMPSRRVVAHLGKGAAQTSRHPFSPDGRLLVYIEGGSKSTVVKDWAANRVVLRPPDAKVRQSPCFSPDGQRLACGRTDGAIELYDLTKPESPPVVWPPGVLMPARPRSFSPDGRWLAVQRGNTHQVSVFDAQTGALKCIRGLAEDNTTYSVEWFPDSTGLLMGATRGHVRGWSLSTQNSHGRLLPRHAAQVYGMAVHPHGQLAITCGYDTQNFFIDWPSGRMIGVDPTLSNAARFSADGRRACLYDEDAKTMRLFDVSTSAVCRQFAAPEQLADVGMGKGSWNAQVSPDGRLLAAVEYGWTSVFDRATARYLGRIPAGTSGGLAWVRGSSELWLISSKTIERYEVSIDDEQVLHARHVGMIALTGSGAHRLGVAEQGDRWMVSMGDGVCTGRLSTSETEFIPLPPNITRETILNCANLSADGRWIGASAEKTDACALYDLRKKAWVKQFKISISAGFWFMPDGETCWISGKSSLHRFNLLTLKETGVLHDRKEPGTLGFLVGSADGAITASFDGQSMCLRDGGTGTPFLWLRHPMPMANAWITMTPNGRWLTYSALGHVQQVWDLAQLEHEMQKLGLPWRGPHLEARSDAPPIARMVLEQD